MFRSVFLILSISCIVFASCKANAGLPGQKGNGHRLDKFHKQKQTR